MIASKYHVTIEEVALLETEKECVMFTAPREERSRIAANIKYHLTPPNGYAFGTKYIRPHIYIFLKKI